jgi:hypothetical protein
MHPAYGKQYLGQLFGTYQVHPRYHLQHPAYGKQYLGICCIKQQTAKPYFGNRTRTTVWHLLPARKSSWPLPAATSPNRRCSPSLAPLACSRTAQTCRYKRVQNPVRHSKLPDTSSNQQTSRGCPC